MGDLRIHNSTAKNFEAELFQSEYLSFYAEQSIQELMAAKDDCDSSVLALGPADDFYLWRIKCATLTALQEIGAAVGSSLPGYRYYRHASQPSYYRNQETLRKAIRMEYQSCKELNRSNLRRIKEILYTSDHYLIYAQGRSKEARLQIYKYLAENEGWAVQRWIDEWNQFLLD